MGLGLPEVIHLTAGFFVSPRVSVDARVGGVVYSPYVGIGATRYLTPLNELDGGGTFYLSGGGRFNPGTTSTAGQEQVLWAATASVGRRSGTRGFFLDARLTAWVGMTNRELIAFPSLAASVGFAY